MGSGSFSLAECGGFSLAGLFLGKENLPDGACEVSFFLLESAEDSGWQCVRAPPSEFHDSYFNDVFTHFHTF